MHWPIIFVVVCHCSVGEAWMWERVEVNGGGKPGAG